MIPVRSIFEMLELVFITSSLVLLFFTQINYRIYFLFCINFNQIYLFKIQVVVKKIRKVFFPMNVWNHSTIHPPRGLIVWIINLLFYKTYLFPNEAQVQH
ncbi:Uncharacterised protein [Legionella bozemanae]|uniref:Uncharacterized protein n=1 Tax=Legionella bozemanae TaxID=447 RepID=A0A0W0RSC6_LEGBO|nr:hypothetical protein Lboz_1414 [Legionella bozemanae]STO33561.1 Uncharacterised protein [Legionella bozemanae]